MDSIESKGKSIDEAVFSGLIKMDASIDEVDIEILDEGSGLFKSAKVRLTMKKDANLPGVIGLYSDEAKPVQPVPQMREQRPAEREYRPRDRQERRPRENRDVRYDRPRRPEREQGPEAVPGEPQNNAEKFLYGVFERMGVRAALKSEKNEDGILNIDISGRGMGMLIGRRGETLDALQYLTSLVLNSGSQDYTKVMLDTENYRKKREDALKRLAVQLADRVVRSGKRVVLEPMNPYERRILHATLQGHGGVTTYSEGEEPFRSVVVALKGDDEGKKQERA